MAGSASTTRFENSGIDQCKTPGPAFDNVNVVPTESPAPIRIETVSGEYDISGGSAPSAITVGASDANDTRANFSNAGYCTDLYAPGVAIKGAFYDKNAPDPNAFVSKQGTSMASPHVAGVVVQLLGDNPGLTPAAVENQVLALASMGHVSDPKGTQTHRNQASNYQPRVIE